MKLKTLEINNFKGIEHYKLELNGSSVSVYGDNGAGKIFDAYSWLLFDKDSQHKAKLVGRKNVECSVEAVFALSDNVLSLRKVESVGKIEYYINSAPVAKRDFDDKIQELGGKKLKILISPRYFCKAFGWQEHEIVFLKTDTGYKITSLWYL